MLTNVIYIIILTTHRHTDSYTPHLQAKKLLYISDDYKQSPCINKAATLASQNTIETKLSKCDLFAFLFHLLRQ